MGRRIVMVCARGGMCAHVAPSEGCLFVVFWKCVLARGWLLRSAGFAVCVSVCLWMENVRTRVLPVGKVYASVGWPGGSACIPTPLGVYCGRPVLAEL